MALSKGLHLLLFLNYLLQLAAIVILLVSATEPNLRNIDPLGAVLTIGSVAVSVGHQGFLHLSGRLRGGTLQHIPLVFDYARTHRGRRDLIQSVMLVSALLLLIWIYATGQGNYNLDSAHHVFTGQQSGYGPHPLSFSQFNWLARITYLWIPISASLVFSSNSVLLIRATSHLTRNGARITTDTSSVIETMRKRSH